MFVLTCVISDCSEQLAVLDEYYFHRDLEIGDLIDLDIEGRPSTYFGIVTMAFNRGRQKGDDGMPCRTVFVKAVHRNGEHAATRNLQSEPEVAR